MATLASYALTTVADVKELLGIDAGNTTKDNLIIRKINQATGMIEGWCGKSPDQHFASATYTNEEYDGTGSPQLILRNRPVTSITSLQFRNSGQNVDDWDDFDTETYFTDTASLAAGVVDLTYNISSGFNRFRVTYVAGYSTIPHDLAEAAAMIAAFLVDNGTTGTAVKAKTQGPKKIEYYDTSQSADSIIEQLGLSDTLSRYAEPPILADK